MNERALRFGESTGLVGILTEPDPGVAVPGAPVGLLLNSGIIHRVGASRLYVQIARQLAANGFTSLRFDFSGIGDSEARRDSLRFEESAVLETSEAMDLLARVTDARRFALMGLCSGADMAYWTSLQDERVVCLVQLDPFAYRTPRWFLRHYGAKVLSAAAWKRAVAVRMRRVVGAAVSSRADGSEEFVAPEYRRVLPPRREVAEGLRALARREVRFFVGFSGDEEHFNYPGQYAASFPEVDFGGRLHVEHFSAANHTFTDIRQQVCVVRRICAWFRREWAREASVPALTPFFGGGPPPAPEPADAPAPPPSRRGDDANAGGARS